MSSYPEIQHYQSVARALGSLFQGRVGLIALPLLFLLLGCAEPQPEKPTPLVEATLEIAPTPSPRPTIALAATFTPLPGFVSAEPSPTASESSSSAIASETATPVSFDEVVVDLRYAIPALGLDRYLQGDMANRIHMVDEMAGTEVQYRNQGGVLLELRQALSTAELSPIPTGCSSCVYVEYELSLEDTAADGWLQDDVLLASIENYLSVALGPHFPPGTLVGLRRSASPYAPAHTIALTEGGELWKWLATDHQVLEPTEPITTSGSIPQLAMELSTASLEEHYLVSCQGSPVETLYINDGTESRDISIICPEYSIPSTLLPLYLRLDAEVQSAVAEASLDRPPAAFPLAAILKYWRADGRQLTLFHDGQILALDVDGTGYTSTLTAAQHLSFTHSLLESGVLQPGLENFPLESAEPVSTTTEAAAPAPSSLLVLRGPDGFYNAEWSEELDAEAVVRLNELLDEIVGIDSGLVEPSDDTGTPTAGPTIGSEEGASATSAATSTPAASQTPTPEP